MRYQSSNQPTLRLQAKKGQVNPPYISFFNTRKKFQLIGIHVLMGLIFSKGFNFLHLYAYGLIVYTIYKLFWNHNKNGIAHMMVAYIATMEVYFRMTKTDIPWQYGKYSLISILIVGLLVDKKVKSLNAIFIFYFLFLLPSITQIDVSDQQIPFYQFLSAALSGPLSLAVSFLYFNKRIFSLHEIKDIFFVLTLGLIPCLTFLIKHITSLGDLQFSEHSNLSTSAGFGPNQVSTALGTGLIIIFLAKLLDLKIFSNKYFDWIIGLLFFVMGILTFSRGGTFSGVAAMAIAFATAQLNFKSKFKFRKTFFFGIILVIAMFQVFQLVDNYTGGALYKRYSHSETEETTKYLTGRDKIIMADIRIYLDNRIFGVGPGMAYVQRVNYGTDRKIASHTEFTRLLAEHGFFGILSLLIILLYPLYYFLKTKNSPNRLIFLVMIIYALLTMGHSSMRLALVGLLYGMAFLKVYKNEKIKKRVLHRKFPAPRNPHTSNL